MEILGCAKHVKEIIQLGTSGWSPKLGGLINPGSCDRLNPSSAPLVRIGDLCVSPYSINWSCRKTTWSLQCGSAPNQCARPASIFGPDASFLYGKCIFTEAHAGSRALAQEIAAAARSARGRSNVPQRNANVTKWETAYWGTMFKVNGQPAPLVEASQKPAVYNYRQCIEIDSQFFYAGAPWEIEAREFSAQALRIALGKNHTAKDVIAVSAMEAIGAAEAIYKYNKLQTTKRAVPYAYIRGNSNWLHNTIRQSKTKPGVWVDGPVVPDDFASGYMYAIASYSSAILTTLQLRCEKAAVAKKLKAADVKKLCSFKVDYA